MDTEEGRLDKLYFLKKDKHDIILVQVYVDDIIFGSTKKSWCDEFEALMKSRFQMSSMGELTFFLGIQVKQKPEGIFISQDEYVAEILKKFDFESVKTASTPIETQKPLVKDEEASVVVGEWGGGKVTPLFDTMLVQPAQDEGASSERLSVEQPSPSPTPTGEIPNESLPDSSSAQPSEEPFEQQPKPSPRPSPRPSPTPSPTSTTEAEYVAAASCCGQNPVYHSKTKHIAIRHHFIRDAYEKKLIQVLKIHTNDNVADLLTKAFDVSRFQFLVVTIGMINP
ncbi:putative ribonuclease H-like domain-containing protein [Tanacetum coccineum]